MGYSEEWDEDFEPDNDDEFLGYHRGCGGSVYQKVHRGRRPSLRDPGDADDVVTRCSDCGEELVDNEITKDEEEALEGSTC